MKTLYIARHAKSSWEDFSLPDHDRPILPKGEKRTRTVGQKLKSLGEVPDLIISSTAKRARQTANILAAELNYPEDKIELNENLYHAWDDKIFSELYGLNNDVNSVMIVAHNPGLTDMVNNFTEDFIYNLPTSAVAKITFLTDRWEDTNMAKYKLEFILTPKMLENSH